MNAQELFTLNPIGATVAFTDGTPKPPAGHKRKVKDWEGRNGSGVFMGVEPKSDNPAHTWSKDSFVMRMSESPVLVVNLHFSVPSLVESGREFTVTHPNAGAIIACSTYGGRVELVHMWAGVQAAYDWGRRKGYNLADQRWTFYRADGNGGRVQVSM